MLLQKWGLCDYMQVRCVFTHRKRVITYDVYVRPQRSCGHPQGLICEETIHCEQGLRVAPMLSCGRVDVTFPNVRIPYLMELWIVIENLPLLVRLALSPAVSKSISKLVRMKTFYLISLGWIILDVTCGIDLKEVRNRTKDFTSCTKLHLKRPTRFRSNRVCWHLIVCQISCFRRITSLCLMYNVYSIAI